MEIVEVKAIEWQAEVPGYRAEIRWTEGWTFGEDAYPEAWRPIIWDLERSDCPDYSDQIYPPEGTGHGYASLDEAVAWVRSKLSELSARGRGAEAGPVNVDANGAPV